MYASVVHSNSCPQLSLPASGFTYELLTPGLARRLETVCGRRAPGTGIVAFRLSESTEEFVNAISRALSVGLDSGVYIGPAGDSIHCSAAILQRLACA
jgi:hypothetical protein